jgi:hypothetical protein
MFQFRTVQDKQQRSFFNKNECKQKSFSSSSFLPPECVPLCNVCHVTGASEGLEIVMFAITKMFLLKIFSCEILVVLIQPTKKSFRPHSHGLSSFRLAPQTLAAKEKFAKRENIPNDAREVLVSLSMLFPFFTMGKSSSEHV